MDSRTFISEKFAHQIFLIFLMKPWFHKCKKVTVSLFGRKFKIGPFLAKNGPKLAIFDQNSPKSVFFVLILKVTHQIFLTFLIKPRLYKCKKMTLLLFCRKFKIGPFFAKNGYNLATFSQKSPFILCFDLILSGNFFYTIFV